MSFTASAVSINWGCTCPLGYAGGAVPVWYATLRDCRVHGHLYQAEATPQWWHDQEARNAKALNDHRALEARRARPISRKVADAWRGR